MDAQCLRGGTTELPWKNNQICWDTYFLVFWDKTIIIATICTRREI